MVSRENEWGLNEPKKAVGLRTHEGSTVRKVSEGGRNDGSGKWAADAGGGGSGRNGSSSHGKVSR